MENNLPSGGKQQRSAHKNIAAQAMMSEFGIIERRLKEQQRLIDNQKIADDIRSNAEKWPLCHKRVLTLIEEE